MSVFENIKAIAANRGWTIKKVAEKAGIGEATIYRWKTTNPSTNSLEKVANVLGVRVTDLLVDNRKTSNKLNLTIEEALDSVMSYDGKPVTDNDREVLRGIIEGYLNTKKG